jgi:D-glycero-D-manno-heptose 1,7-bisphosphate phosphatase
MHSMLAAVGGRIDAVFYCPHSPAENCHCRKPASGLFEQIAERYGMGLATMPAVGDTPRDMVAAIGAGCTPHVVQTGKGALWRGQPLPEDFPPQTTVHADLSEFADYLVARS